MLSVLRVWVSSLAILAAPLAAELPRSSPEESGLISVDFLRYRLPAKARPMLEKARSMADAGNHSDAIVLLEQALAKYPGSAAWAQSMLGVEYAKTGRFADAVMALEQAVLLLPHDSVDHSNLGASLAAVGQWDLAEQEARRALELDRRNVKAKELLDALLARQARDRDGLLAGPAH
jgi:Flp pilus assembly protein TadD